MAIYIGVDPGSSGGIAVINEHGRIILATPMPPTDREILDVLGLRWIDNAQAPAHLRARAVLERVWSSPGWGHVGAFRFGLSYGQLRMALLANAVPFDEVLPRDWQRVIGVSYPKKKGKPRDKNITKRRAEQLFPSVKVTHAIADALLLAEYGRRTDGRFHASKASQRHGGRDGKDEARSKERREEDEQLEQLEEQIASERERDRASAKADRQASRTRKRGDVPGTRTAQGSAIDDARESLRR